MTDPIARMDQAQAATTDLAKLSWSAFASFLIEGFTEDQAITLTGVYVQSLMTSGETSL